jgi:hypothetical protein
MNFIIDLSFNKRNEQIYDFILIIINRYTTTLNIFQQENIERRNNLRINYSMRYFQSMKCRNQ